MAHMTSIGGYCHIKKPFCGDTPRNNREKVSTLVIKTISLIKYPHAGIMAKGVHIIEIAL